VFSLPDEFEVSKPFAIDSPIIFDVPPDQRSNILTPEQVANSRVLPQKLFKYEHSSVLGNRTLTIARQEAFYITDFMFYYLSESQGGATIAEYNAQGTLLNNIFGLVLTRNVNVAFDWVVGSPDYFRQVHYSQPIRIEKGNYIQITLTSGDLDSYGSAFIFGFDE
jgi:hypothetical protein